MSDVPTGLPPSGTAEPRTDATRTADPAAVRPLTAAQRTIWFDEVFSGDDVLHTMGDHLDVTGPLDVEVLGRTLAQLVREAETLRVRLVVEDGVPGQVVADDVTVPLDVVDLTAHGDAAHALALTAMHADQERAFDLTAAPLVRATLFVLGPERHLCYLAMHHVLCDGFSRVPLYARLATLYRGLLTGEDVTAGALPPLQVLLDAEQAYLASRSRASDERYWQGRADALGEPLSLSDEPAVPGRSQLRRTQVLPADLVEVLRAGARDAGVTWAAFVVATTAAYLGRAAGRTTATLTLPVTSRVGARTRAVPGMVANYLPLVADVAPRTTRAELLGRVSRDVLAAVTHQRFRGEDVRRMTGTAAADRTGFGPYVNVLPQPPVLDLGPARATLVNLSTGIVDDLMVTVLDGSDGGVELHVNGNPARYAAADVAAHAARLADFLHRFATAPADAALGSIPVLAPGAGSAPAGGHAGGAATAPSAPAAPHRGPRLAPHATDGVVERVRRAASLDGDAVAVVDDRGPVRYRDLVRSADRVARAVHSPADAGAGPTGAQPRAGLVGAVLAEPGRDVVAAVLGLLAAGGAFVPLDVRAPAARVAALLQDCGAELLLVDAAGRARAAEVLALVPAGARPRVVDLDALAQPDGDGAGDLAPVVGGEDDVAYVLFTSGTTGRPKGAMVHRGGLLNHLDAKLDLLGLTAGDCVVQNAPLTFDVSIWQMLAPLVVGGTVRCVPPATAADPDALAAVVADDAVTVLEVVPSLLKAALDLWRDAGPALSTLRFLMVTGEALPVDLARRWTQRHPHVPLLNAYGPTECSDDVAHAVITPSTPLRRRAPVGVPIRNTDLWVLGPDLAPLPPGAVGELFVSGEAVGAGYLHDPVKTAVTFVADPFGEPGRRMYRTGDRVRWSPEGQLEFVERLDHQVKIRGQRVELGEIEAVLRTLDGVDDAAVLARTESGLTRLDAYLTGPRAAADLGSLPAQVASLLPEHMVPARWAGLDALPLTAHGKVDRAALAPLPARAGSAGGPPPSTPVPGGWDASVETVRLAFAGILDQPGIGPDDDFFAVGGDSVAAIQVVAALRRAGLTVTPRAVLELGTARALARAAGVVDDAPTALRPDAEVGAHAGPVEPTPIAADLARATGDVEGTASSYCQVTLLRVPAELDADVLAELMSAVVDAHPMLRLRVADVVPGVWAHRTEAPPAGLPHTARVAAAAAHVRTAADGADVAAETAAASARLSPAQGTVWQAVLLTGEQPRLLLAVHHLAVDGVSWRVLRDDLARAWAQHRSGATVAVEPEPTSFAAYAAAQGAAVRSGALAGEVALWRDAHAAVPRPRLDARRHVWGDARRVSTSLGPDVVAALVGECPALYRADINDLLLGALAVALADVAAARGSAPATPVVELEGHGREEPAGVEYLDLSRTVGWFTSTFPVPLPRPAATVAGSPARAAALTDAVKAVHQRLRSLPAHGIGHGMLRNQHPQGHLLLDDAVPALGFNYLGRMGTADEDGAWTFVSLGPAGVIGTATDPRMPLRHELAVTAMTEDRPDGPHLVAEWLHAGDLLDGDEVRALAHAWQDALRDLVAGADRPDNRVLVPADTPLVEVTAQDLRTFAAHAPGSPVTDVLPLTPIQRGMLVHAGTEDDHPDPYVLQVAADLVGPLDAARLRGALDALVAANPVLGAQVLFTAAGTPVQVLREERTVPLATDPGDADALAAQDLARRFDLAHGPALRARLVPAGPDRHRLVLTLHHLLVDGWSMPLVVDDLLAWYAGTTPAPRPPVRHGLARLGRRDTAASVAAWRAALHGLTAPTLVADAPDAPPAAAVPVRADLDRRATDRLVAWAREHRVTVSTVVQVAWGAMLAEATGAADVVLGATVSTRPADLDGVEDMIGMFLATVPVRVRRHVGEDAVALVRRVQHEQAVLREHAHVNLSAALAGHPALAGTGEVFDTAVVVENFPTGEALDGRRAGGLRLENARTHDARHFPLSLVAVPGETLRLRVDHLPGRLVPGRAEELAGAFRAALDQLVAGVVPAALRELPAPDGTPEEGTPVPSSGPRAGSSRAARTPDEQLVCDVLARVLGHDAVGPEDNFFLLGGDSISAIHVVTALREHGLHVAPRDVFTHRTPAALAAAARSGAPGDATAPSGAPPQAVPAPAGPPAYTDVELDELDSELGF
ncbi:amino acid adenylation domain-containing protein [Cellulomonas sp. 179-A 4D5 NHS]|uniref:amino acid adenylation domain-containing protein n=1 Tax=Cellulomonas sp. 179-A 4D5 NHS TaxID=3142378 RepID=UPI0039A1A1D3